MSFNYPSQQYFKGVQNVSFNLSAGQIVAIVGKSGSGKTTLLKCIYGLEDLQSGEVVLNNELVTGPSFNLIPGHEDMKLVSQEFYVLDNHTVEENIFDKLIGYTNEDKQKRASKLLSLLELNFLKNTRAKNLSSGQKQRVAIARALAVIPKVLLLDEPFSNLDNLLTEKLFSFIIKEVKKNNTSVLLITHLAQEALKYAQQIIVIDEGKIVQSGEKWQVYYQPKSTKLAGLLGDFNILKAEDFTKKPKNFRTKILVRPDKLKISATQSGDLQIRVVNCTYNGKCYELLTETKNGNALLVYNDKPMKENKDYFLNLL